jgi:hypothetical protein
MFDDLSLVNLLNVLRVICLAVDTIGILVGLDLVIGAPIVMFVNNVLNKVINFDKSLAKPTMRISLGILFVVVSGVMMYVTLRAR